MASPSYTKFRELLDQKSFREAASLAERNSLLAGEDSSFWLTQRAVALNLAGRCDEALKAADEALRKKPGNPYALLARAEACLGSGRPEDALACYEEALRTSEARVLARARRGVLQSLSALKHWPRVLGSLGEWNLPAPQALPWRVKALAGLGRREESLEACAELLRAVPDNRQALWEMTELEISRDGLEAVRLRFARLARIPSRPSVYREIYASLCRRAGKVEEALGQYEKLSAVGPDVRIQKKQIYALAKAGREQEALPLMEEQLRLSPADFYMHTAYDGACARLGDLERKRAFYQELISRYPDEKSLYGRLRKLEKILGVQTQQPPE